MRFVVLAVLLGAALPAQAVTITVDFSESIPDRQLVSYSDSGATFTSCCASDAMLRLHDGILGVGHEPLRVDFAGPVSSVSLDFGGDFTSDWQPGAYAWLRVGDVVVTEPLNLDGLINQSISVAGIGWFTGFDFTFSGDVHGDHNFAIDNLRFETVPEPGTLGLGALLSLAATARWWSARRAGT